jgi:hypothetical protein
LDVDEAVADYAEDLAATVLAVTMDIPFDPETAWEEGKQLCQTSGLVIKTVNIMQSATGNKKGLWTTTLPPLFLYLQKMKDPRRLKATKAETSSRCSYRKTNFVLLHIIMSGDVVV